MDPKIEVCMATDMERDGVLAQIATGDLIWADVVYEDGQMCVSIWNNPWGEKHEMRLEDLMDAIDRAM